MPRSVPKALLSWARATEARWGGPALWLFTDRRLTDPAAAASRLPRGGAGVVFRSDHLEPVARAALLRVLARICRERRLPLLIAGASHARGRGLVARGARSVSAHGVAGLVRGSRAGVRWVFISPVFATRSHPGVRALGVVRSARLARLARVRGLRPLALGGIDDVTARRLPRIWAGMGGIDAFSR